MTEKEIEETQESAEKDTSFDGADTPTATTQLPDSMATIDALTKRHNEEAAEPLPLQAVAPSPASLTDTGRQLEGLIGASAFANLDAIYRNRGQTMNDLVTIEEIPKIGHIEVQNSKEGNPKYLVFYDVDGNNITQTIQSEAGIPTANMNTIIGEDALQFTQIMSKSTLSTSVEGSNKWSPSSMGNALDPKFQSYISTFAATERRTELTEQLKQLRSLMLSLNTVFAFDDYRHLEAFMAAWMMKDSTCRLSGVPGTGKTTVIECAATLLANSYGFNTGTRLCAPRDYELAEGEKSKVFNENTSKENIF